MTRSLHILVAEDDVVNQLVVAHMLKLAGHTVVVAGDGRAALAAWETRLFDLVLMDVQMPTMDGFEATVEIRRRESAVSTQHPALGPRHTPIVAVTANAARDQCLAAGMDGYLAKPFRPHQLLAAIDSVLPTDTADGHQTEHTGAGNRRNLSPVLPDAG